MVRRTYWWGRGSSHGGGAATHQREAKGQGTAPAISPSADGGLHSSKQLKLLSWFLETGAFVQGPSNHEREWAERLGPLFRKRKGNDRGWCITRIKRLHKIIMHDLFRTRRTPKHEQLTGDDEQFCRDVTMLHP
jgi:hypothetical protein